jgi:hypothetical protein
LVISGGVVSISRWSTALTAVVLGAGPLLGQELPVSSCRFDSAAFRDPLVVWLAFEPPREAKRSEIEELTPYGIAIAQRYRQPTQISFRTWPGTYGRESETRPELNYGGFGMDGILRLVIGSGGHLAGEPHVYHDSPEIMRAIRQAVVDADSAGVFGAADANRNRRERKYTFRISGREQPREGAVAFARLPITALRLEEEPTMLRPGAQRYPEEEKRDGRSGKVRVYYVIDRLGKVIPNSIVALELSSPGFAQSAETMLLGSTFTPGMIGGCPVATGVYQTVNFEIR